MVYGKNIIERAYELAREGQCRSMDDIRRQLTREGFESVGGHMSGSTIKRQLDTLMKAAAVRPPASV